MIKKLKKLIPNALAPNSNFRVTSIIVDEKRNEYEGVNVEYAIPTNAICAERNAISSALTLGMEMGTLREVHIYAESGNNFNEKLFTPPCGACRQAIVEASNSNCKIFLYNSLEEVKEYEIKSLIPDAFKGGSI